jgi:hypothetical protein
MRPPVSGPPEAAARRLTARAVARVVAAAAWSWSLRVRVVVSVFAAWAARRRTVAAAMPAPSGTTRNASV